MEYQTNAPKGAALLSEKAPGWSGQISLKRFDINSIFDCVLAQVFGGYIWGLVFLFGEDFAMTVQEEYGFCQYDTANGIMLQSEWIHIITELQDAEEAEPDGGS